MTEKIEITKQIHRQLGVDLFNQTWDLMEKPERTTQDDDEMIHAAHASRYHWGFAGEAVNLARGEWQISRVYSVLSHAESALYHAQRCLDICLDHQIGDFDLAFAYEALARGFAISGNIEQKDKFIQLAKEAAAFIKEKADRELLLADLKTIP